MQKQSSRFFLYLLCLTFGAATLGNAATWYVATDGDDNSLDGTDPATPLKTISNAVVKASGGDNLLIQPGTYTLTTQVVVDKTLTITGNGATRDDIVVDVNNLSRGFYLAPPFPDGKIVLEQLTVKNGDATQIGATERGGGISASVPVNRSVEVRDCVVSDCTAYTGGGIYFSGASSLSIVTNSLITGNTATLFGGGVHLAITDATITHSIISLNHAVPAYSVGGGGIYMQGGKLFCSSIIDNRTNLGGGGIAMMGSDTFAHTNFVDNCVIKGNWLEDGANHGGGGIRIRYNSNYVSNSVIANNSAGPAGSGGGINFWTGGGATVTHCWITNNVAGNSGGGLIGGGQGVVRNSLIAHNVASNNAGGVTTPGVLEGCTVVSNTALNDVGGIWLADGSVFNTIIYFNDSQSTANSNVFTSGTGVYSNSCFAPLGVFNAHNNVESNPALRGTAEGEFHLSPGSPCINAGTNQPWMDDAFDLDGEPRIRYGIVDIGAYEVLHRGSILKIN